MYRIRATYRILAIVTVVMSVIGLSRAQSADVLLNHYDQVPTYYNPAATGSTDFIRIRGAARLQWLGIHNAPKTFLGVADMPVKIGTQRIGVGVSAGQESLGLFSNLDLGVQLSYKLKLFKGTLSIGLQTDYFSQNFKGSKVELPDDDDYHESTDEAIPTQDLEGNTIDLAAGVWYTHDNFRLGISGRHLMQPVIKMSVEGSESTETQEYETELPRTLYFTGGCNIPIKNTLFELQPSLIVATDFTDFTGLITAAARYNRFLSFGLSYRWKAGIGVLLGAEFKNFFIGYAYEYPLSAIAKASSGSHELMAGYRLKMDFTPKNKNKHKSIRIM
ncbi:MAG: PorP/SprF family type IX secretion system membrane protein [Muribaculum sp.]|nr:PorP/SprF family type IX secretion system membrane protein [Muribaculum sp.]